MSNVTNKREYLVEVNNLKQYFPVKTGFMKNTPNLDIHKFYQLTPQALLW